MPTYRSTARLLSTALLCVAVFTASLALCRPHERALLTGAAVVLTIDGAAVSAMKPVETSHATHCPLQCIAAVALSILLLTAVFSPGVGSIPWTVTRLFARLGLPPLLPPPRSAHTLA